MVEAPLWVTVLSTLALGSIASVIISGRINNQMKKRDQFFEMAKHKMDTISKSMPTYTQLGSYYDEFSTLLLNSKPNLLRAFYVASRILYLERTIFEKYGTIQLDSLEAEYIITSFELNLGIDRIARDTMGDNARENITYKKFVENGIDGVLFRKFKTHFLKQKSKASYPNTPNLQQKCNWYCQLMFLEINEIYSLWYGGHPLMDTCGLTADLRNYLVNEHPDYYNRIRKWEIGGYLKL